MWNRVVIAGTDQLRQIADDFDELGEPNKFWAREGGHELGTPFEREVGR